MAGRNLGRVHGLMTSWVDDTHSSNLAWKEVDLAKMVVRLILRLLQSWGFIPVTDLGTGKLCHRLLGCTNLESPGSFPLQG